MNRILSKKQLFENIYTVDVEAPLISRSYKVGNFIIIRVDEHSERLPYNIIDVDNEQGVLRIVVDVYSKSSKRLVDLPNGSEIADIIGPLGKEAVIKNFGNVLCVVEGIGIGAIIPIVKSLKAVGCKVNIVTVYNSGEETYCIDILKKISDKIFEINYQGDKNKEIISKLIVEENINKVYSIASPMLMASISEITKKADLSYSVYLNTMILDGIGMCGTCRLKVGDKTIFVCIDGPELDGNLICWNEVLRRTNCTQVIKRKEEKTKEDLYAKSIANAVVNNIDDIVENLTDRNAEWRKELRKSMKPKERMSIQRVEIPLLDPKYRATTRMEEVSIGLSLEMAINEAHRCLDCAKPTCVQGCPVNNNIPSFIKNIERGNILGAAKVLKSISSLPAICGRVCPHEKQCEGSCIHLKSKGKAVAIGSLERFAADYERESGNIAPISVQDTNGIKIAVVGSGPAGLSFAGDMIKKGFEVYVFEALHELGGVLKYGIPEFRLPNKIVDVEIENLKRAGVYFLTDTIIGKTITVDELKQNGFKGIFIGVGAGIPNFMNIPGENAINILSSNEYLTRLNLMDAANSEEDTSIFLGKKVIVVGGGNTAMDSCRTAKRMGADVTVVYRRSENEMPAGQEEIQQAKDEGINFLTLHNPREYLTDKEGRVRSVILDVMELGEPDESGRRSPKKTGKVIELECDQVIVAVGVIPNYLVPKSIKGLELGWKSTIVVDENMCSSDPLIYAGGDIVHGPATVVLAMGDGRKAAKSMAEELLN